MSGRKKAGSWQEGVARTFSRLFSKNHSQDKEESDKEESDSTAKSASSKETNQEIKQEAETEPAGEATDRQEDENTLKSEVNTYQPSEDPIVIPDNNGENNSSVEVQGEFAASEEIHEDCLPRVPPEIKPPDHDRQPKDNFLLFLGNLFNFTPKTLSTEVKQAPTKKENSETENEQKDQSSLCEGGPLIQKQPDVSSLTVSTSKEEADSTTEDTETKHFTPASPALPGMESNKESTKAPEQLHRGKDAPAVTYATYRGSRQIRKLLKRRASVDSTIPEKDLIENQNTFIVTECGEIENIVNITGKNEAHLPNGIAVGQDTTLAQYHVPNRAVKSKALIKNISLSIVNEMSNSLPNLSLEANSIAYCNEETDKEHSIQTPVSTSLDACNKLLSSEITLLNNCFVDKDDTTSSTIPGVVNSNETEPTSNATNNIETSNVPFQPMPECLTLEHCTVSSYHISDKVNEEINLEECKVSLSSAANDNMETNVPLQPKSECLAHEHSTGGTHHIHDKVDNEIHLKESKVNNNFTCTSKIENSHLSDLVTISEEMNGDNHKPPPCIVVDSDASPAAPESEDFNKTSTLHLIWPTEPTCMTDVEVPAAEVGSFSEGKVEPISMAHIYSPTKEPDNILLATIKVPTATKINLHNAGDMVCPSAFTDGDDKEKNDMNNRLCDGNRVSNQAKPQFEDGMNNMSSVRTDECGFENAVCPAVASDDTSVASGVHLTNVLSDDALTDASCVTLVSSSANINEFNPDILHSDGGIQGMSDLKSGKGNVAYTSTVLLPKNMTFQSILPASSTFDSNLPSTAESYIALTKSIVAEKNTLSVSIENGTSVNQLHAASTSGDDKLDKLEPPSVYDNGSRCLPSFLTSNSSVIRMSSSDTTGNTDSDAVTFPLTSPPEDCKFANEDMEGYKMNNSLEEQVAVALESEYIDGNIVVAKISVKSVNVDEVKMSPCIFQSEVVKLSTHSSKAFEPEYVLLPNLSPPVSPVEPADMVNNINSIPAIEKFDIPSPAFATIHDQANTFPSSIDGKNENMLIISSPCIYSKDVTVESVMAKTNCIGDSVESFNTTNEDIVIDNIHANDTIREYFCDIFPSVLKHENTVQSSATHTVVENRKVTANNVLSNKDLLRPVEASVIDVVRDLINTDSIAFAEGLLSLEMGDGTLMNPCPPPQESIDVCVPIVFSDASQSKNNVETEVLPSAAISKPISNNSQENVVNLIRKGEGMLGDKGVPSLLKSKGIESKKDADVAISDPIMSNKIYEHNSVKENEEIKTVTFADFECKPQYLNQMLLKKADKIAFDVLHLSLKEIKSTQKTTTPVFENPLRTAVPDFAHGKKERESAMSDPVESFHGDDAKNVLIISGSESNVKNSFNRACNDTSLKPETFYTENLLAQKAEQIIKDVMYIVKQQLSSGQLQKCLDKNHNETIVKTANPVFTENITALDETTIPVIEPLWSNICTSVPVNYPLKETKFVVGSFPTIENGVSVDTEEVAIFLETLQNDVATSEEENGLFSFDDSTTEDSDFAEMFVDTVNVKLIKEEMKEDKWNQKTISIEGCAAELALQTLNENERTCMENVDNYDSSILFTIPENISKNNLFSKDKKDRPQNTETERQLNNVRNVLQHEAYTQKNSLAGDGSEEKNEFNLEGNNICLPLYPLLVPPDQNVEFHEENEDATPYYFEGSNLINVTNNDSELDSFEMVQAKPFRVFPFALSPIYEDDSSQEDVVSSDNSPGCCNKRSPKESSSILSLLQSVSERLKHDNSVDDEEEESVNENLPATQNEDYTGHLSKAHTEHDKNISSSQEMSWSSLEDSTSFLPKSEHLLTEASEDSRNLLSETDKGSMLKSASRSVYYQYLQNAKDYSSGKGPRLGSILHEILMPKPIHLQVDDSLKAELPLVNPVGIETLKYNPRPGKMVVHDMLCSGNKIEICSDVHDATNWAFPSEAWIRVVRGCWVLHEKPSFQGRTHVLEEGETILNNPWDLNNLELSSKIVTIGSIQRLVKDGAIPELEMFPKCTATTLPSCLHSEIANVQEHTADIPTSIIVKSGAWLAYSEPHYKGTMAILEPGPSPIPADFQSLRPLKMGGLKVQLPLDPTIIVYEKSHFSGWCKMLTEHVNSVTTWFSKECNFKGIGSIRVCGGVWVAYDHERYKGHQHLLEEGEYADWHAWGGVSDAVLSFRYLQADFLEAAVTLYESDAEDGKLIDIQNQEISDLEQVGFCSETRSIHVQRGVWVAYQQKHFCGQQYVLEKGKYKCFSDWGGNNNTILSIRPVMLEPIGRDKHQHLIKSYSGEHFHGHCTEYTSEASDFKPEVPCSFRVLQGCWLLGYQGDAAEEQCVLEEGHYPDLASCGCPSAHITCLKPIDYVFAEPLISLFSLDSCEGRELYFEEAVNSVLSKDLHFYTQSVRVRSGLWIAYEGANFLGKQMLLETGEILNWSEFSRWKAIGSLRPMKQPAVYVRIKNRAQDKYLTVTGKLSDVRATTVCIAHYNGKNSQIWYFCRGLFKSKINHACLDVIGGRDVPGSKVALWTEHGKSRQKWRLNKDGTITSYISNELVLDVKGGNYYDKNSIIVNYPVANQPTQRWEMEIL
ncbi:very large A-kinase anchor protein [Lissotriton helveticus]